MTIDPTQLVRVSLGDRSYPVAVGAGSLASIGERIRGTLLGASTGETPVPPAASRAFVVIDRKLSETFVESAVRSLESSGYTITTETAVATEQDKSFATVERLLNAIARTRHERTDPVIAIGGGVVGDVAGFVAATYRRGVPVVQCPTTLLSMVDASIGGKTGVNLRVGDALLKNMAGAFWQPRLVVADVAALRTLPDRHLRAGLAECLKHGMLSADLDASLFDWTSEQAPAILQRDEKTLIELVRRNIAVKARIVEADEREASEGDGGRALLNLGHTFAHAIETIPHLTPDGDPSSAPLLHGEAVALGLVAATACSASMGLVDESLLPRVSAAVEAAGLPVRIVDLPDDERIIARMSHDKKAAGGRLRLTLPVGEGRCRLIDDLPRDTIVAGLAAIRV